MRVPGKGTLHYPDAKHFEGFRGSGDPACLLLCSLLLYPSHASVQFLGPGMVQGLLLYEYEYE